MYTLWYRIGHPTGGWSAPWVSFTEGTFEELETRWRKTQRQMELKIHLEYGVKPRMESVILPLGEAPIQICTA